MTQRNQSLQALMVGKIVGFSQYLTDDFYWGWVPGIELTTCQVGACAPELNSWPSLMILMNRSSWVKSNLSIILLSTFHVLMKKNLHVPGFSLKHLIIVLLHLGLSSTWNVFCIQCEEGYFSYSHMSFHQQSYQVLEIAPLPVLLNSVCHKPDNGSGFGLYFLLYWTLCLSLCHYLPCLKTL